jgi:hypothetical protein
VGFRVRRGLYIQSGALQDIAFHLQWQTLAFAVGNRPLGFAASIPPLGQASRRALRRSHLAHLAARLRRADREARNRVSPAG